MHCILVVLKSHSLSSNLRKKKLQLPVPDEVSACRGAEEGTTKNATMRARTCLDECTLVCLRTTLSYARKRCAVQNASSTLQEEPCTLHLAAQLCTYGTLVRFTVLAIRYVVQLSPHKYIWPITPLPQAPSASESSLAVAVSTPLSATGRRDHRATSSR